MDVIERGRGAIRVAVDPNRLDPRASNDRRLRELGFEGLPLGHRLLRVPAPIGVEEVQRGRSRGCLTARRIDERLPEAIDKDAHDKEREDQDERCHCSLERFFPHNLTEVQVKLAKNTSRRFSVKIRTRLAT